MSWIDWEIIHRSIKGNISPEEEEQLEHWMQEDPKRRAFVENACSFYNEEHFSSWNEVQLEAAWQKFRIKQQNGKNRRFRLGWLWSAAAAVLLFIGYHSLEPRRQDTLPTAGPQHDIIPGGNTARLILSDGTILALSEQYQFQQTTDNEVSIHIDSSNISYTYKTLHAEPLFHTIQTPQGGTFHMTLSDGSQVWLNAKSSLTFPVIFPDGERRVVLEGEAYFQVKKDAKRFVVETMQTEVHVLGTSFNVNAYKDETSSQTTLVEGNVVIFSENGISCKLEPGEQATWDQSSREMSKNKVNIALYTQWKEGKFIFRNNRLKDIMRTLSRWYNMTYEFRDSVSGELKFYGIINKYENIDELLAQFEKTEAVKFEYVKNHIIIK